MSTEKILPFIGSVLIRSYPYISVHNDNSAMYGGA